MKKIIAVLGILIAASSLSACNTMRGFGQDVQRGGEKVEGAAERNQNPNQPPSQSPSR